jgi:FtsP/CotA-like multicopper oxidase with cupredoxin domain
MDFVNAGQFKDHRYPNVLAGYDQYPGTNGDPNEALGTLWYHDHRMDFTAQNTYKGLSGFYLLFDDRDSGNETDTNPAAFRLPSGAYDIPLLFADKSFDSNGQLYFDLFNTDGILGDKFLVNGVIQPFLRVAQRKYRFRLLNSGPSRFYEFSLSNGMPFTQISNDGNLLEAPLQRQSIRLSVAERADVVVDFTNVPDRTEIILLNRLEQEDGRGPTDKILPVRESMQIMKFIVDGKLPKTDPSRVPATLRRLPPVNTGARVRTFKFERTNGQWAINGELFDPDSATVRVPKGGEEIWVFQNSSGGWQHPGHIHFEEFQILSRNGNPPPPWERSRKDVLRLGFNEEVRIFMRFRDFAGKHVMHCHNTLHEDDSMMLRWDIVG